MRGLQILRSDTDRRAMVCGGNLMTRYHYRLAKIHRVRHGGRLDVGIASSDGRAEVDLTADLSRAVPADLPTGSPFADPAAARRYAGPLPYTFSYEPETRSMIVVKAARTTWEPRQVPVDVRRLTFFGNGAFSGARPVLAGAFHVSDLDYGWTRGSRRALDGNLR